MVKTTWYKDIEFVRIELGKGKEVIVDYRGVDIKKAEQRVKQIVRGV